ETLRRSVGNGREMLQANEHSRLTIENELAGVRGAHADHNDYIDVAVDRDQVGASGEYLVCSPGNVVLLEHRVQIGAIGLDRRAHDVQKVGPVGIENVVMPIGIQETAMRLVVRAIGSDSIGALQYGEKVRNEIDEHFARVRGDRRGITEGASKVSANW